MHTTLLKNQKNFLSIYIEYKLRLLSSYVSLSWKMSTINLDHFISKPAHYLPLRLHISGLKHLSLKRPTRYSDHFFLVLRVVLINGTWLYLLLVHIVPSVLHHTRVCTSLVDEFISQSIDCLDSCLIYRYTLN